MRLQPSEPVLIHSQRPLFDIIRLVGVGLVKRGTLVAMVVAIGLGAVATGVACTSEAEYEPAVIDDDPTSPPTTSAVSSTPTPSATETPKPAPSPGSGRTPLVTYAEAVCQHPLRPHGERLVLDYELWDGAEKAREEILALQARISALTPPAGLEGFHGHVLVSLVRDLASLESYPNFYYVRLGAGIVAYRGLEAELAQVALDDPATMRVLADYGCHHVGDVEGVTRSSWEWPAPPRHVRADKGPVAVELRAAYGGVFEITIPAGARVVVGDLQCLPWCGWPYGAIFLTTTLQHDDGSVLVLVLEQQVERPVGLVVVGDGWRGSFELVRIVRQPEGSVESQEVHALFDAIVASVVRVADGTFVGW